jgi:hypothetical protein
MSHSPHLSRYSIHLGAVLALSLCLGAQPASAAQIHESDLVPASRSAKPAPDSLESSGGGHTSVRNMNIDPSARTGTVTVSGSAKEVTTHSAGQNTSASSAVGSVEVGHR